MTIKPQGEVSFKAFAALAAGAGPSNAKGATLGPGLWALNGKSSVPYARLSAGWCGTRDISWGESFHVPEGHQVAVSNGSFHAGDAWFTSLAETDVPPTRPPRITIAATITNIPGQGGGSNITSRVDTRLARKCFLAVPGLQAGLTYMAHAQGQTRGQGAPDGSPASQLSGDVQTTIIIVGPLRQLPVGMGQGDYLDPAGNTLPEYRPMALLDTAWITAAAAVADPLGFQPLADAFWVLEY